jgi:hypothetical protein
MVLRGITYHHMPERCGDPICDGVCVANHMAKTIKTAPAPEDPATPVASACGRLKVTPENYALACESAAERYQDLLARYES